MDKDNVIINAALDKYRSTAVERVKATLCNDCRDKRCQRGARCNTYELLVEATAWEMTEAKDN